MLAKQQAWTEGSHTWWPAEISAWQRFVYGSAKGKQNEPRHKKAWGTPLSFSWATSDTVIAESRQHQGVLEVAEKTPVNY